MGKPARPLSNPRLAVKARQVWAVLSALAATVAPSCGARLDRPGADAGPSDESVTLSFLPDVPVGREAYLCFGFDIAAAVRQTGIKTIEWRPADSAVALHHGKLYVSNAAYPSGPVACDEQPTGVVPLQVWAPGSGPLVLPAGVALALPDDALSLVVEAHVLRFTEGQAIASEVRLTLAGTGASHTVAAGWTGRVAPVPALRPGHLETSVDRCTFTDGMRVYFAWPHQHLLGRSFSATVTGPGRVLTLADVPTWNFARQVAIAIDADIVAGDVLDMTCTWLNNTDHYVFPGPKTTDEMCGLGLIVSPPRGSSLPCLPLP